MRVVASAAVREKLRVKHGVTMDEVEECFANRCGKFLRDTRERHDSDPPTLWFVAETDYGRKIKVAFIQFRDRVVIRTAYLANEQEIRIYEKLGKTRV